MKILVGLALASQPNKYPLLQRIEILGGSSQTTLDHIRTNDHQHQIVPGIFQCDISDHFPVFCKIDINHETKITKKRYIRDLSNFKIDSYSQELNLMTQTYLQNLPSSFNLNTNYEQAFQKFVHIVKSVVDKHTPLKIATRTQSKLNKKPWITRGLTTSIRKKQKLYKTHFLKESSGEKYFYRQYANKLNKLKYILKKIYLYRELEENKLNPRKIWKTINSLLYKKTKSVDFPSEIKVDESIIDDPAEVANCLNKHLCSVGKKLAQKVQNLNDINYTTYLKDPVSSSHTLLMLYFSLVYSRIQYGITLWGTSAKSYMREINVRLNNVVRSMTYSKKYSHVSQLYKHLNLLKLNDIYKFELAKFMYLLHNKKLPAVFSSQFTKIEKIHSHNTRQINKCVYFIPQSTKSITQNLLAFRGTKLWSSLNSSIKNNRWGVSKQKYIIHLMSSY